VGPFPAGATVTVVATVTVSHSMNHLAYVRSSEGGQEYPDDNRADNASKVVVYADKPPKISGSKKLILRGLPDGCFSTDFTLLITARVPDIKKVVFTTMVLDEFGNGDLTKKSAKKSRLRVRVPVSKYIPVIGEQYEFKVKVRPRGRGPLIAKVSFERCEA
jgi:hypothetical protein